MKICDDCKNSTYDAVHYVGGAVRCKSCSDIFSATNFETRHVAEGKKRAAHRCEDNIDICENCCEHFEYDHGICLDCGKDCTDDLVCAAEYAYEGDR